MHLLRQELSDAVVCQPKGSAWVGKNLSQQSALPCFQIATTINPQCRKPHRVSKLRRTSLPELFSQPPAASVCLYCLTKGDSKDRSVPRSCQTSREHD